MMKHLSGKPNGASNLSKILSDKNKEIEKELIELEEESKGKKLKGKLIDDAALNNDENKRLYQFLVGGQL